MFVSYLTKFGAWLSQGNTTKQSTRQQGAPGFRPGSASEIGQDSDLCHEGNNMSTCYPRISGKIKANIGSVTK